jgi:hypothetical protein
MPNPYVVHHSQPHDVFVGRPTIYGNPFLIGRDGTRQEVIQKFREWFFDNPDLMRTVREHLRGKVLGCWCAPQRCHADILAEYANGPDLYDMDG